MNGVEGRNRRAFQDVEFGRRDQLPFEVEVLRLEDLFQRPLPHDLSRPQRIHFHAILLIGEGDSFHEVDFEPYPTAPGAMVIVPAKHVQSFAPERVIRGELMLFTAPFLNDCSLDTRQLSQASRALLAAGPLIQLGNDSFPKAARGMHTLAECTSRPPARFAERVIATAFSLLLFTLAGLPEVAAASAAHAPQDALATRFLEKLEQRFASEHRASFYAGSLHVSLRTLDRHLATARGQTTRQMISSRLVLEAKRLLTERDIPIKSIAYDLGFSEPQNFTRFFRTQTGCSPGAFRQALFQEENNAVGGGAGLPDTDGNFLPVP